jgi:hypothetical protein
MATVGKVCREVRRRFDGVELPVRAGIDTAEWALDRADVRDRVRHERPRIASSFPAPGGAFEGHRYLAVLRLPTRYALDGLRFQAAPDAPPLTLARVGVVDGLTGRGTGVSLTSAYVSDTVRLTETAATPNVRLFEVARGLGRAWVVDSVRRVPDEATLLRLLREPTRAGIDARREALVLAGEAAGLELPAGSRSSRAELARQAGGRLELRAEGPGLLVVTESWSPGWSAVVDQGAARLFRVNGGALGVVLTEGTHRIVLTYEAPGLAAGARNRRAKALHHVGGHAVAVLGPVQRDRGDVVLRLVQDRRVVHFASSLCRNESVRS